MYLNSDYIDPATLTGYARASLADQEANQFTLSQWLPSRDVDDLEYRFTRGGEGLIEAATFRAYDAESPIGARAGFTRVSGELPPISRKIRLGEYDRLRQRKLEAEISNALYSDSERMVRSIAARLELARGDALVNGQVTISENGVIATVTFGRSGSHSVTTSTSWATVASATVIQDLVSWCATYRTTNGVDPGVILISTQTLGYMLRNAELRTLAGSLSGTPALVSQEQVRAVFAAHGLPPFRVYDAQVKVSGSATRVIAADKVLLLPADGSQLGATLLGTTAESMEPGYGLTGDEAGIVAGVYKDDDPVALWTKAAAIGLPVLVNPDLTFVADVIP